MASLYSSLWRWETLLDDQSFGLAIASRDNFLSIGPKEGFQNQLRDVVNERVTALANEILKARAD